MLVCFVFFCSFLLGSNVVQTNKKKAIKKWFNNGLVKYQTLKKNVEKVIEYAINIDVIREKTDKSVIVTVNKNDRKRKKKENYFDKDEKKHILECLNDDENKPQARVF
ncbi:UNVERIFIED_CONTAM: hypothetical protein DVV65_15840, partial [Lactiplantibacillus plantarum]|nr:hypothetical protein [Lactiplantibacillus plantarum]